MAAPAALESLRVLAARKVKSYTISQIGCRYVVIRHRPIGDPSEEKVCVTDEDAIAHLFAMLKQIPDTPGDLRRTA